MTQFVLLYGNRDITQKLRHAIFLLLLLHPAGFSITYYVAPDGDNSFPGTKSEPFATPQKANDVVNPGDTVFIRGGIYNVKTPKHERGGFVISKSGKSDNQRIYFWAFPGETPIFDFADMKISTRTNTYGFLVSGSWLHFKGFEIRNLRQHKKMNGGMYIENANDNIIERMNFHHIQGTGLFIAHGNGGHLIINCDSHDNYDPTSSNGNGEDADGFGVHYQTKGKKTTIRGCRAWWNSDDGYDLISQEVPVIIENCYAMGAGYSHYGTKLPPRGNGNGFKAGSSKKGIRHFVRNCVAWNNEKAGFDANHSSGGNTWYNNTSFQNGSQFDMMASIFHGKNKRTDHVVLKGDKVHILRNNIGFPHKNENMEGVDSKFNTWDLNITPKASDFRGIDDPSVSTTGEDISNLPGILGPRQKNGEVPDIDFLKLAKGSQMIDKGTEVGLKAVGPPDLGAYEYGGETSVALQWALNIRTVSLYPQYGKTALDMPRRFELNGKRIKNNGFRGRFSTIVIEHGKYDEPTKYRVK